MIKQIRIQNLRSLVDTGFIEIKPLTILLGANSSGKSTFLRSFPLFTQSVNKSLREPISWFDDAFVDFGDYDTAKSKLAAEDEGIIFSYKIQRPLSIQTRYHFFDSKSSRNNETNPFTILPDSTITLSFLKDSKGTFVNRVVISKEDLNVEFKVKERDASIEMFVNDEPTIEEDKWTWNYGHIRKLIPEFELQRKYEDKHMLEEPIELEYKVADFANNVMFKYCSKRLFNKGRLSKISSDWTYNKKEFLKILQDSKLTSLQKKAMTWNEDSREFKEIYNALAILHTINSLDAIDEEIRSMYSNCSYIAPMRAAANRYYRTQGLQVRDVDPYGKNLQEFISSLNGNREKAYRNFTEKVLGLQVVVKNNAGHQQIILKSKNGENNMTDVGFGYSQILPIITKLWHSNYSLLKDNRLKFYYWKELFFNTILIEQPELHLHPAMQARTADILMMVLTELEEMNERNKETRDKNGRYPLSKCSSSLIVETHSQAIINRIGRRIREKQFSADKVNILMFEKNQETGRTEIKEIKYNENGQLTNWPLGFFDPNDDIYDSLFDR